MTLDRITKDTQLNGSFAAKPSNMGTRFHNYLYEKLDLPYVYKAFSPHDITGAVIAIRALPMRGAAVSMPFKEDVIELIDELDPSASMIQSVNTIVNNEGTLTGYNTDFTAVKNLLEQELIPMVGKDVKVVIQGSGGMAKAVAAAFKDVGFSGPENVSIIARNKEAGSKLANEYGFNHGQAHSTTNGQYPEVLVNVTPLGMNGELSFPEPLIQNAKFIFDVVAFPAETPLIEKAKELNIPVITGDQVHTLQSAEQFELYTGEKPSDQLIAEARRHALSE